MVHIYGDTQNWAPLTGLTVRFKVHNAHKRCFLLQVKFYVYVSDKCDKLTDDICNYVYYLTIMFCNLIWESFVTIRPQDFALLTTDLIL
jgi:hypothetical protein